MIIDDDDDDDDYGGDGGGETVYHLYFFFVSSSAVFSTGIDYINIQLCPQKLRNLAHCNYRLCGEILIIFGNKM